MQKFWANVKIFLESNGQNYTKVDKKKDKS